MPKKFSTSTQTPVKNPLNDLPFIFYDEFQEEKEKIENNSNQIETDTTISEDKDESIIETKPEQPTDSTPEPTPTSTQPEIDFSDIDPADLTIDQLIHLKLQKYDLQNVTLKHLGYTGPDGFVITEYDVIDNKTKNVLLIVNVRWKEIRFQIPKHLQYNPPKPKNKTKKKADPTPMELVAKELRKELKYGWSDWF